jgi:uncharacterized protein (DUF1501 family)
MALRRRGFLKTGILGMAGATLPEWALSAHGHGDQTRKTAESAIMVLLRGGISHLDTFDPKPDAPAEVRGEFGSIATAVPGIRFCEYLPELSARSDQFALIRGVSHKLVLHDTARNFILTGAANATVETPSLGAAVARFRQRRSEIPAYMAIPQLEPNAGELGQACESYNLLGNSGHLVGLGPKEGDVAAAHQLDRRVDLLEKFEKRFSSRYVGNRVAETRRTAYQEAVTALKSAKLKDLAELESESTEVRSRYGTGEFGKYLLLARRAIEQGARFVTVVLADWDTHYENFPTMKRQVPELDKALSALIDDLQQRGLSQKTLLVVESEFGRTPAISKEGGRDHWPHASCALLMGGGICPGRVLGATDVQGGEPVEGQYSPSDIANTLLTQLGIDPLETLVPPTGRVLLPFGRHLEELF